MTKPILVTLTSCSTSGKTRLLNFIRDIMPNRCIISTTTRKPRVGEIHGVDYYFISEAQSIELEERGSFAEMVKYNGVRYGVTNNEFFKKVDNGIAFLIVEPNGVNFYSSVEMSSHIDHLKVWIDMSLEKRLLNLLDRITNDLTDAIANDPKDFELFKNIIDTGLRRQKAMLTEETSWKESCNWDLVIDGMNDPASNLTRILNTIIEKNPLMSMPVCVASKALSSVLNTKTLECIEEN